MTTTDPGRGGGARQSRPEPPGRLRPTLWLLGGAVLVLAAYRVADIDAGGVTALPQKARLYGGQMIDGLLRNPFQQPWQGHWSQAVRLMLESLAIAWVGTLIGALGSFPLAFLAASNLTSRWVVVPVRQLLNAIRAVPEVVLAILVMLPIFGYGNPLAGALAIGIHSVGTLGKLTSEAVEAVAPGPIEALTAAGAGWSGVIRWGVVPQMLPEAVAFWLYRFEINIRASAILGVLGAGGIGTQLSRLFQKDEWERIGIVLVVIIVITIAVDQVSAAVRHRIIHGRAAVPLLPEGVT